MFFKPTLISIILGALCVNALSVPVAREPAPEPEYAGISDDLLSREAGAEIQELDTRVLPLLLAPAAIVTAGGLAGIGYEGVKTAINKYKSKREILDNLVLREVQDWTKWAESVRN